MSMNEQQNALISAPLAESVILEGHLLSTRTADAYKGLERSTGKPVCIWKLRHPLSMGVDSVQRFLDRLKAIKDIDSGVARIRFYGVEPNGLAYCVMDGLDGHPLLERTTDPGEAERRFLSCAKVISNIHRAGLVCGDLCGSSFWLTRSGEVQFIGVMGSFDTEAVSTAMMPPLDTLHYVATEQRMGGGIEPASDVFSLGVLAYQLFTGKSPFGVVPGLSVPLDKIPEVHRVSPNAPEWIHEVILRCLESSVNQRVQNASSLLQMLSERRKFVGSQTPVTQNQNKSLENRKSGASAVIALEAPNALAHTKQPVNERTVFRVIIISAAVMATLAVPTVYYLMNKQATGPSNQSPVVPQQSSSVDEEQLHADMTSLEGKAKELEVLVTSDDPISHPMLVKAAVGAANEELRSLSEKALLARVRRLGYARTADHLRQWLRFRNAGEVPPSYETLLKATDPSLPIEGRASLLRQSYPGNERVVLRLAAAYALDSKKLEEIQPLIAQLVGDAQQIADAQKHSAIALMIVNPELSVAFSEDLSQLIAETPDEDLRWLLSLLAERQDPLLKLVANQVIERKLLPPQRIVFLELLKAKTDMPVDVSAALIKAASGSLTKKEVASFGTWFDPESEKALIALCAETYEPAMMLDIFDILAGKNVTTEPVASFLKWIRNSDWNNRAQFISVVGFLGTNAIADDERMEQVVAPFAPHLKKGSLMQLLIDSKSEPMVSALVRKFGEDLSLATLIKLLEFPDKKVRLGVLPIIAKYNDVGVFKLVIERFEKEKDPEVQAAYSEHFWVIKERQKSGAK